LDLAEPQRLCFWSGRSSGPHVEKRDRVLKHPSFARFNHRLEPREAIGIVRHWPTTRTPKSLQKCIPTQSRIQTCGDGGLNGFWKLEKPPTLSHLWSGSHQRPHSDFQVHRDMVRCQVISRQASRRCCQCGHPLPSAIWSLASPGVTEAAISC
jgi:hypothetical protein